ncbi:amino acid kinase family protein [Streptomyces apocyni]|uniref:amino acid kinase family protein n=1 Tax=Streptomyces apocyni TaxID=2654677 RepID=UPI0018D1052E|nr:acetylglutamate kinase [Streptomyces apocyni]
MTDEITVVKCGGGLSAYRETICQDLAAAAAEGPVVLVHGGAAQLDELAAQLGVAQRRISTPSGSSSRYTDPATLDVLLMAMAGRVKPALVAALSRHGARPVGLTGMDAGVVTARRVGAHKAVLDGRTRMIRDDHSGRIHAVDPGPLRLLLDAGLLPVLSPPALGADGEPVNVDADRIAAAVAGALGRVRKVPPAPRRLARTLAAPGDDPSTSSTRADARHAESTHPTPQGPPSGRTTGLCGHDLAGQRAVRLVLLTSAPGVLRDPEDPGSLLPHLMVSRDSLGEADSRGGMTAKLQAARQALDDGVAEVVVADGRLAHPLREALAGAGTRIEKAAIVGSGSV